MELHGVQPVEPRQQDADHQQLRGGEDDPDACRLCGQQHAASAACPAQVPRAPRSSRTGLRSWVLKTHPLEPPACAVLGDSQSLVKKLVLVREQSMVPGEHSSHCFSCTGHDARNCPHKQVARSALQAVADAALQPGEREPQPPAGAAAVLAHATVPHIAGSTLPVEGQLLADLRELIKSDFNVPSRRATAGGLKSGSAKASAKKKIAGTATLNNDVCDLLSMIVTRLLPERQHA